MTITNLAAGEGTNGIVQVISNIGTQGQLIGGAIAIVAIVIAGVMLMTGAFSGGMRKGIAIVAAVLLGCFVMGGGTALAPMVIKAGHDTTNQQTVSPQNGSVN